MLKSVAGSPFFIGRKHLLQQMQRNIVIGQSCILFGGAKIGMSAFLQQLHLDMQSLLRKSSSGKKFVTVYIDLKQCLRPRIQNLCHLLLDKIATELLSPYVHNHASPPRISVPNLLITQKPWQLFDETLQDIWTMSLHTKGSCQYALLIDHVDTLVHDEWVFILPQLLQLKKQPHMPHALICAGGAGLWQWGNQHAHMLQGFERCMLGVLQYADVRALGRLNGISMPDINAYAVASGMHPFILQRLYAAHTASAAHTIAQEASALHNFFAGLLDILQKYPQQTPQRILRYLIMQDDFVPYLTLLQQFDDVLLQESVHFLTMLGLVECQVRLHETLMRAGSALWNNWWMQYMQGE